VSIHAPHVGRDGFGHTHTSRVLRFNPRAPRGARQPPALLLTCQRLRAVLRERAAAGVPNSTYIVAHRRQPTLHIGVISFREPPRFPMSASPSRSYTTSGPCGSYDGFAPTCSTLRFQLSP